MIRSISEQICIHLLHPDYSCMLPGHLILSSPRHHNKHVYLTPTNSQGMICFVLGLTWSEFPVFFHYLFIFILATTMRETWTQIQKACLRNHKINLTSLQPMGMIALAVTLTLEECSVLAEVWSSTAAPQAATAFIPQPWEMLYSWPNANQLQPACHSSLHVCGQIFIPSLFSQTAAAHCLKNLSHICSLPLP